MSNQLVLQVTCVSFLVFVLGEVAGAIIGKSWSLLGDAAAMSIDVMTYFCNMQAERIKARKGYVPPATKMILEVYVPTLSVTALLAVTAYVSVGSVHDILYPPEDDDVNIYIMYGFAAGNTVVDIISVFMFVRMGRAAFMQDKHALTHDHDDAVSNAEGDEGSEESTPRSVVVGTEKNLNMISAFTHVGGDSLRTISIFVAALIANLKLGAPYLCDAWAAVIVTVTIVLMVIPLISEIWKAYHRLAAKIDTIALAAAGLDSPNATIM